MYIMSYIRTNSSPANYFNGFGNTPKAVANGPTHPDEIIRKATHKDPAKVVDMVTSPVKTMVKKGLRKAAAVPSDEERIRALIEKVLLEYDLILPNPHWDSMYR